MKRIVSLIISLVLICTVLAGCSAKDTDKDNGKDIQPTDNTVVVPTDDAIVKDSNAIQYIESNFSREELGLDKVGDDYKLMVSSNGVKYDGERYVKVVAGVVTENEGVTTDDGKKTYSLNTVAEFLISFDGKTVLKKAEGENDYTKLKSKTPDYSAKGDK